MTMTEKLRGACAALPPDFAKWRRPSMGRALATTCAPGALTLVPITVTRLGEPADARSQARAQRSFPRPDARPRSASARTGESDPHRSIPVGAAPASQTHNEKEVE